MIARHRKARTLYGAVEHNGVIYFSGHAADDINTGMAEQTRQTCAKLEKFLTELGSDKSKILQARIYLSDMSRKEEMNAVWLEWIDGADLPSRATIGGCDLGDPRRLIEIVLTAAKD
jgi:enamine deaminase RidA (YjgF/YER057c/UK114 family)